MFGILFEFIRSFRNSATDYRSSIAFALDQFIKDHGEMGDDEIYEAILADVGNEDVANQIFVFLPISFTREHLKNQPVKLADHYYRSVSGKKSRKIRLKSLPIYNQICEIISQRRPTMTEEEIRGVLDRSAEFKVINTFLLNGGRLETLSLSAPVSGV